MKTIELESNREIIITLIQADLKHHQLLGNLRKMELHTDYYALELYQVISQLMGLGEEIPDPWFDIYDGYVLNAHLHPVSSEPDHLLSVAEECYDLLAACVKVEKHLSLKVNERNVAPIATT